MLDKNKNSKNQSIFSKCEIIMAIIILFSIPFLLNFFFWVCNFVFASTGLHLNAFGLGNTDWLSFWGSYCGGIATMVAVVLTLRYSEKQYEEIENARLDQQRLDVLPLLLFERRMVRESDPLVYAMGEVIEKPVEKNIPVDELIPWYEEFDITEITVLFGRNYDISPNGLSDEEIWRVKNQGQESDTVDGRHYIRDAYWVHCHPFWLVNVGKERAINIRVQLLKQDGQEICHLKTVFSLDSKNKIKLNILVNIELDEKEKIFGEYILKFTYNDIFLNLYEQVTTINLNNKEWFRISLGIDQTLKSKNKKTIKYQI